MSFMVMKLSSHPMKLHPSLSFPCQQNWWYLMSWNPLWNSIETGLKGHYPLTVDWRIIVHTIFFHYVPFISRFYGSANNSLRDPTFCFTRNSLFQLFSFSNICTYQLLTTQHFLYAILFLYVYSTPNSQITDRTDQKLLNRVAELPNHVQ